MRSPLRLLAASVFCLLLSLSIVLCAPAQAAPRGIAIVLAERGTVECERSGTATPRLIPTQTELYAGDVVETGPGGEADILFGDGSQVKLSADAKLVITLPAQGRPSESLFQALLGVIWAHLRPGQTIQSPSANIVVRGTEVLIDVTADRTVLTVTEGDAQLINAQGSVDVSARQQSTAVLGKAPTPPETVDITGLIAWTADVAALPLEFVPPGLAPKATDVPGLETAAQAAPGDVSVWTRLGAARRAQGDLPGALAAYTQAVAGDPKNMDACVGIALTFLSQGKDDQARDALAPVAGQAQPLAVLGLADLHDGKGADAVRTLTQALAQDRTLTSARALLALADLQQNDLTGANTQARRAARHAPRSAQVFGTLAMVQFLTGDALDAEASARRAVRLDPLSPLALLAEGRARLALGDLEGARTDYERAAAIAPSLWLAPQELGTVYLEMDMPDKAAEEDRAALRLDPRDADALTGLGLAAERQGRYVEAEADHRQALALEPGNVSALYNLGALHVRLGRLAEARTLLAQAVKDDPKRGIVYARLAELSLYRQDLFTALEFARRAVSLLPSSGPAHYELGRVYLEQDRTVQAEQEFREAVTLDGSFAAARYALGVTQEKTDGGLLASFDTLLGSASVGSPGTSGDVQNLETPGANERIQAAIQDPTAVRVASRSYGDTELDAEIGEHGTRDLAASYLSDSPDGRGVGGVTAEEQANNDIRPTADSRMDAVSALFGKKAADGPSAFFVTGDYQDLSKRDDIGITSDPYAAIGHTNNHLARAIAGVNLQSDDRSEVRAIVQVSRILDKDDMTDYSFDYNKIDFTSVNGEVRWDRKLSRTNTFITGLSLGTRTRDAFASVPGFTTPTPPATFSTAAKYQPYQFYMRDDARIGSRVTLTGEAQVQKLDAFENTTYTGVPGLGTTITSHPKTFVLPYAILAYQADARSDFRLRYRRLFATIDDFQLLAPTDVFLISFAGLPQPIQVYFPSSDGTSVELEYDHTFGNASFLSLAAAQQDIRQGGIDLADSSAGGPYAKAHVRIAGGSYEGLFSRDVSFALTGNFNYAHDSDTGVRIAQVPDFDGLATLQYLNRAGAYVQTAYYYQGNRVNGSLNDMGIVDRSHQGGFGVLNLRIGKRFGLRSNVFVQLNDALNKKYDVGGVLQPNRQVVGGVSLRF